MVDYNIIDEVITQIIKDYYFNFKCWSRKRITERLNNMTEDEKIDALNELYDNGIISDYEAEYWDEWSDKWNRVKDKDWSKFPKHVQEELEALGEAIYQIESKIVTKQKNELSDFNPNDYKEDTMPYDSLENGKIEQKQVEAQDKALVDVNWDTYGDACNYYGDKYYDVSKYLIEGDAYFDSLKDDGFTDEEIKYFKESTISCMKHMDYLINKSGGLVENTVLYRGGAFPPNLLPGMKGKFPCYQSTSYNREKAEGFRTEGKEYLIKIYAPKGTKGLSGNGHEYGSDSTIGLRKEHEFTLNKGQKYIVLDRNDKDMTVSIMLI